MSPKRIPGAKRRKRDLAWLGRANAVRSEKRRKARESRGLQRWLQPAAGRRRLRGKQRPPWRTHLVSVVALAAVDSCPANVAADHHGGDVVDACVAEAVAGSVVAPAAGVEAAIVASHDPLDDDPVWNTLHDVVLHNEERTAAIRNDAVAAITHSLSVKEQLLDQDLDELENEKIMIQERKRKLKYEEDELRKTKASLRSNPRLSWLLS